MLKKIRLCILAGFLFSNSALQASEPTSIRFSVITTAESSGSLEAMVVKSGSWFTKRKLVHTAVLVSHPKGDFLFDTGIGKEVTEQMSAFSFFEKQLFSIENVNPAVNQLEQQEYNFARLFALIPSHMHWDHASGIEDFINIPVWIQPDAYEEAIAGKPPGFVLSQYDSPDIKWQSLTLNARPYETFEKSLDLFGDGSALLVDLSGHTQGQLGLFLNLASGKRYFFIGDTTWSVIGINQNKPRPVFVEWLVGVDSDFEKNNQVIDKIHTLSMNKPNIVIVPAHDEQVIQRLPSYPLFSDE